MTIPEGEKFRERLRQLDAHLRSIRRVRFSMLFLIGVVVVSGLAYRAAGMMFHPRPHIGTYAGYRNV